MTGVMPLPPETNRIRRGRCAGKDEVAADRAEPDHHAAAGALVQECRDQPAVVLPDRQLEVPVALGVGRRVAAGVATPVDLDAEVDVLAGLDGVGERVVGRQDERHTARGVAPHVDDLGAALGQRPGRCDQLGVPVDAMRTGQQAYQVGAQHPLLQSFGEHVYTVL